MNLTRYLKNSGWMLGEQAMAALSGLVIGVLIARSLGPDAFGVYVYALAIKMLCSPLCKLGLDNVLIQRLVQGEAGEEALSSTAFWMRLFSGACVFCLTYATVDILGGGDLERGIALKVMALTYFLQPFEVLTLLNQARVEASVTTRCVMVQLVLSAILKLVVLFYGGSHLWFVALIVVDALLLSLLLLVAHVRRHGWWIWTLPDFGIARALFAASWPLIFSTFAVIGYARIDQVMIGQLLNSEAVAFYNVGVRLTEVWLMIPSVLAASFFPALIDAHRVGAAHFEERMSILYTTIVVAGVSVALVVLFVAKPLIVALFGGDYAVSAGVFKIRIWETVFAALGIMSTRWLHIHHLQKKAVIFATSGLVMNVILNFIMIPHLGIEGAAYASVLSILVSVIVVPAILRATRPNVRLILRAPWIAARVLVHKI